MACINMAAPPRARAEQFPITLDIDLCVQGRGVEAGDAGGRDSFNDAPFRNIRLARRMTQKMRARYASRRGGLAAPHG